MPVGSVVPGIGGRLVGEKLAQCEASPSWPLNQKLQQPLQLWEIPCLPLRGPGRSLWDLLDHLLPLRTKDPGTRPAAPGGAA